MTKDKGKAKWAVAKRMVQITQDEWDSHNVEAQAIKFVKAKLQIAIYYLSQLDEHGSNYTMPFTGKQMKEALKAPITKQNVKDAAEWCHQCRLIRDKACTNWNYEGGKDSMNANSYITTDELIYTINHSQEIDRGDEMGPFAVKRGKYIYVYRTWQDARDEEERKPMWMMMIPVNIESLSELYEREDLDADDLESKGFWPLIELISKYAHTPLGFRGTVLSDNDKEELRHRLLGYFKDHSFSEDYRNGRLDAMYGVMCQLDMEDDYDATKGSYKAMKIKAGIE